MICVMSTRPMIFSTRRTLSTLPYRIRVPLAKLQAAKALPREAPRPGALGDGEALEGTAAAPDYVRMALTSRVYDHLSATPLVHAGGLSERLHSIVHLKREDLNPSYTFYVRCAYAKLSELKSQGFSKVFTVSIGSRGHAIACACVCPLTPLRFARPRMTTTPAPWGHPSTAHTEGWMRARPGRVSLASLRLS